MRDRGEGRKVPTEIRRDPDGESCFRRRRCRRGQTEGDFAFFSNNDLRREKKEVLLFSCIVVLSFINKVFKVHRGQQFFSDGFREFTLFVEEQAGVIEFEQCGSLG